MFVSLPFAKHQKTTHPLTDSNDFETEIHPFKAKDSESFYLVEPHIPRLLAVHLAVQKQISAVTVGYGPKKTERKLGIFRGKLMFAASAETSGWENNKKKCSHGEFFFRHVLGK